MFGWIKRLLGGRGAARGGIRQGPLRLEPTALPTGTPVHAPAWGAVAEPPPTSNLLHGLQPDHPDSRSMLLPTAIASTELSSLEGDGLSEAARSVEALPLVPQNILDPPLQFGGGPAWLTKMPRRIAFVDVETTGLSAEDRIVSFAAILVETAQLVENQFSLKHVHIICDPGRLSYPLISHDLEHSGEPTGL